MLLGAMVAMMGSMAPAGSGPWIKVLIALFLPVALGSGMLAGVAVGAAPIWRWLCSSWPRFRRR